MTWFSRSALPAALAVGLMCWPVLVVTPQARAEAEIEVVVGSGPGRAVDQAEPNDASSVPQDLSALSREELETLVRQLADDNAVLRGTADSDGDGDAVATEADHAPDLHDTVAEQAQRIDTLEAQLAALMQRVDQLASGRPGAPSDTEPGTEPAPGSSAEANTPGSSAPAANDAAAPAADPEVGEYLYTYEYGLIREAGRGRVTLRDRDGNRQTTRYDYSEYRDDAIWVTLYFKNESDRPLRYAGLIALGGKKNFNDKRPPLLAQTPFRTPVLQPGEVFDLSQEIDVERPWGVDVVELGKVRSYPKP